MPVNRIYAAHALGNGPLGNRAQLDLARFENTKLRHYRTMQSVCFVDTFIPRKYQAECTDTSFELWDGGVVGELTRAFTGAGKTLCACMKIERWLNRGPEYKVLVVSYERQLVWQFADEIEDFLGIRPGIEMGNVSVKRNHIPRIVVASRQTIMPQSLATLEQRAMLSDHGIIEDSIKLLTKSKGKTLLAALARGSSPQTIQREIDRHNDHWQANHEMGAYGRMWKFDATAWNWLVVFDEAHRFSYKLKSTRTLVDWFDRNPHSRRSGMTATPKRYDNVSIGHKLFPGVSLDYPLYAMDGPCAVKDGYAVPYRQQFITVEGVDFKELSRKGQDFDEKELEERLGTEEMLAKLCEPMLDMVNERRTLVFSPGVDMAKAVASYLNARRKCRCECGYASWYPRALIGDGATCKQCKTLLGEESIVDNDDSAECVHGSIPHEDRKVIYERHQRGAFQFLSACNLCREGYNDPDLSCVAIFRPISRKASSTAEQMKGRASRPLRGLIEGVTDRDERLRLIRESDKPDALIIDLVGVTGLPDCASTALIYGEGLADEVIDRANEIAIHGGTDVENALHQAQQEKDERDRRREEARKRREEAARKEREEAEKRSALGAVVTYTSRDVESGQAGKAVYYRGKKRLATNAQLGKLWHSGFKSINDFIRPTSKQAGRMIDQLSKGATLDEVRKSNKLTRKVDHFSWLIEKASSHEELDRIRDQLVEERRMDDWRFPSSAWRELSRLGQEKRTQLGKVNVADAP